MHSCSIVVRAYNEEKHIGRLLTGINQQTVKDVQVILVDSGSTDATVEIASRFQVEVVHIRPEDFTFGRSLNYGVSQARAEFVVIASAHVYPVYPDWLEKLLAPFSDPQIALTYGKQRGMETTKFSEHQIFHHWFPDHSAARQSHPFCNNANAAIRRLLWERNPYNETLTGLEDMAWARQIQEQGFSIAYAAEAEIIHIHNETWRGIYHRYKREGMAFKQLYPQENFTLIDLARLFLTNTANDMRAARQQSVLSQVLLDILRFRWLQFWGTYQGYRKSGPLTWQLKQAFYYPRNGLAPAAVPTRKVRPIRYSDLNASDSAEEPSND
ncbi:MAG: glycosyltransferase family 2 protein [Anaerolineaceae bacterium]|nr:glycosyltransferase family 2 protein [Anaerolineaceae bacterium]